MRSTRWAIALTCLAAWPAFAATQDIAVTAAGDRVWYREWWRGGADTGWIVDANPNQVSHSYYDGSGSARNTAITFDLSTALGIPVSDITSITFNFKIVDIWTEGRNDVANLDYVGPVLFSGGTGWKSFDVTTRVRDALGVDAPSADFYFSYTGYSGFTFASAEGGNPAFLRIETANVVPEPETYALMLIGLGVLGAVAVRKN